ncbi:MAG TPA: hypothetical protein VK427_15710, partial [Kofleriaceae bacterium]|nr:hypothetical protein [Kofleriaceae bacterium]
TFGEPQPCSAVQRGTVSIDRVPMNSGKSRNLLDAIRREGWVVLTTTYERVTEDYVVTWGEDDAAAQAARHRVTQLHCRRYSEHCARRGQSN